MRELLSQEEALSKTPKLLSDKNPRNMPNVCIFRGLFLIKNCKSITYTIERKPTYKMSSNLSIFIHYIVTCSSKVANVSAVIS